MNKVIVFLIATLLISITAPLALFSLIFGHDSSFWFPVALTALAILTASIIVFWVGVEDEMEYMRRGKIERVQNLSSQIREMNGLRYGLENRSPDSETIDMYGEKIRRLKSERLDVDPEAQFWLRGFDD